MSQQQQQQQQLFKQQTIRERVVKYMSVSYLMFHQVIKVCGVDVCMCVCLINKQYD